MNGVLKANTCGTCAMKHREGGDIYCHRNPPSAQAVIIMTPQGPSVAGVVTVFPKVESEWTCGEFRAQGAIQVVS